MKTDILYMRLFCIHKILYRIVALTMAVILISAALKNNIIIQAQEGEIKDFPFSLYAESAVLIDGETGRVICGKNSDNRQPNASTTKILTCIIALESCDLNDKVVISDYAASMPEVNMDVKSGEEYRLGDLLYAMMLESYNDVAVAVAEHVAGGTEEFADMMMDKVRQLGLVNTHFVTANGLDATNDGGFHGTSAYDLAQIMRYCISYSDSREDFLAITGTGTHSFTDLSKKRSFTVNNHNNLLKLSHDVLSGKTGFTCDAGYCYVGAFERDGHRYVFSLLNSGYPPDKNHKWKDSLKIIKYVEDNMHTVHFVKNINIYDIDIGSGMDEEGETVSSMYEEVYITCDLHMTDDEEIKYKVVLYSDLKAPIKRGQRLGCVIVYIGNSEVYRQDITSTRNVYERNYGNIFDIIYEHTLL